MLNIFKGLQQKNQLWLFLLLSAFVNFVHAGEDTICAVVKLEIAQELTLERQGFEAIMKINNALEDRPLTDVGVEVNFLDANGEVVVASSDSNHKTAKFFIRVANLEGIDNVSGTGELAAASSATARWLIVPAPGAGENIATGTLYYVGATLTYKLNGIEDTIEVAPDTIFVKPMPQLALDYFIPSDVYADDPLTPEIEAIEPFTLGVRVRNNGSGPANKVRIESAQPKITENKQGLLIDFEITGSYIDNQAVANSLLLNFGNIAANHSATGRWVMQTTLSGKFTDFSASFSHADELGGSLTSLIDTVNTHLLIRDVVVDLPNRDQVNDFLVDQGGALTVFESDSVDTPVNDLSASASLAQVKAGQYQLQFTADPTAAYIKLDDPFAGQKSIVQTVRSDGRVINPQNVWLSKTYSKEQKKWLYYFNLFDTQSTGSYFIDFETAAIGPMAPVLQYINNWQGMEGGQIGFLIEASDANGDAISFAINPMPEGAELVDLGEGKALFSWLVKSGQAGNYPITVMANDGKLYANQNVMLMVAPEGDSDGDGLNDNWEMLYFGDLSHDGSGDFDNDGISDKDEFLQGTDPTLENGPQVPGIVTPNALSVVENPIAFIVNNSVYTGSKAISYYYEIYSDAEMSQLLLASEAIAETPSQTSWLVTPSLVENQRYFWRVRAYNGTIYSPWASGSFFFNTVNEAPSQVTINSPAVSTEVDSLKPLLSVHRAIDPDGDEISYQFKLYSDEQLTDLLDFSDDIFDNAQGLIEWQTNINLDEGGVYYWQVTSWDSLGLASVSEPFWFNIYTHNKAPITPVLIYPKLNTVINQNWIDIAVESTTDPDGDAISYLFELDAVTSFDSSLLQTAELAQVEQGRIVWPVSNLGDGTTYFWRVKALDEKGAESPTVTGTFSVKLVVNPPQAPVIKNPGRNSWVGSLTPTLSVYPIINSDRPISHYQFEVYNNGRLDVLEDSGTAVDSVYKVSTPLTDKSWHYFRVRAVDVDNNIGAWSEKIRFFVDEQTSIGSNSATLRYIAMSAEKVIGVSNVEYMTSEAMLGNELASHAEIIHLVYTGNAVYRDSIYSFVDNGAVVASGYTGMSWNEDNTVSIAIRNDSEEPVVLSLYFQAGVWSSEKASFGLTINGKQELIELQTGYRWYYIRSDIEFIGELNLELKPIGHFGGYSRLSFGGMTLK